MESQDAAQVVAPIMTFELKVTMNYAGDPRVTIYTAKVVGIPDHNGEVRVAQVAEQHLNGAAAEKNKGGRPSGSKDSVPRVRRRRLQDPREIDQRLKGPMTTDALAAYLKRQAQANHTSAGE